MLDLNVVRSHIKDQMALGRNSAQMVDDELMKSNNMNKQKIAGVMASITREKNMPAPAQQNARPMFQRNEDVAPEVTISTDVIRIKPGAVKNIIIDSDNGPINLKVGE